MDPIPGYDEWKLATPPEYSEEDERAAEDHEDGKADAADDDAPEGQ